MWVSESCVWLSTKLSFQRSAELNNSAPPTSHWNSVCRHPTTNMLLSAPRKEFGDNARGTIKTWVYNTYLLSPTETRNIFIFSHIMSITETWRECLQLTRLRGVKNDKLLGSDHPKNCCHHSWRLKNFHKKLMANNQCRSWWWIFGNSRDSSELSKM